MNKIIPFNKDITFKTNIGEITSIALDDTLKLVDPYSIKGELIIRGCNKVFEKEDEFSYPLPVDITIDKKYDTSKCSINIDDFYYEIINENVLKVKIDLVLDDLFYQTEPIVEEELDLVRSDALLDEEILEEISLDDNISIEKPVKQNVNYQLNNNSNKIEDLFKETNMDKEYSVYRVYTVVENESLEMILDKYKVTKECLMSYNDLSNFQKGMKLVIPSIDE